MGLDMYLRAKTTVREHKDPTGACSGLFGLAPASNGTTEIGYWRKAYDQLDLITDYVDGDCCDNLYIKKKDVSEILKRSKEILETHTFDDEGYDVSPGYNGYGTWNSKRKWEDTVKFFTEAEQILKEDKKAKIYFCYWA